MTDDRPFQHIRNKNMRCFLTAYAACGHKGDAARAAGIHPQTIYNPDWRKNEEFQESLEDARLMAADVLEDAAHRRALDGLRSYKFDKEGIPLRHPDECDCGHPRVSHRRIEGETPLCLLEECPCPQFIGRPYYEEKYSDLLLIFLTKGVLPHRYREIREVRGVLAKLDLNMLPNDLVARIAAGEHPEAVLAAGASEYGITPGELVRGALKPGPAEEDPTGEP